MFDLKKEKFGRKLLAVAMSGALLLTGCTKETTIEEAPAPEVTGSLKVSVLDVGKADCILFQTETKNFMIDTAEKNNGKHIRKVLEARGITHLDFVEISHYDKDHIGGLRNLLKKGITIDTVYAPEYETESSDYTKTVEQMTESGLEFTYVKEKVSLTVDDVLFEIYPAMKEKYKEVNNKFEDEETDNEFSLVTLVKHGTNRLLFAGDACNERLQEIPKQINPDVDFLKVPHHGREDDYTTSFLKKSLPEYAVITCSAKNVPDGSVLTALEGVGAKVYLTEDGQVDVECDGKTLTVTQTAE